MVMGFGVARTTNIFLCLVTAESSNGQEELSYVDLSLNPERYTGYSGHSPQRIWKAIYHENCFRCVNFMCGLEGAP